MKNTVFLSQKVDENIIFTDCWKVLVLIFSGMRNTAFSEPKSCWKDDIYWLRKSSCFDLFGNGKYGLFWAKKLMERWYLLVAEKFLFWTFRWWEIRPFFQLKSWWKDDIYLVFLSFPWYPRTWEIWFFAQCDDLKSLIWRNLKLLTFLHNMALISVWSLYYHILATGKLRNVDLNKTSLEGTTLMSLM